jgi:ribonuclease HII
MPKVIAGIDEAGRGAVIGPLVIAGVSILEGEEEKLKRLNVRDSKMIAPRVRERLAGEIEKMAKDVVVIKVEACKIDTYQKQGINLNRLEAMKFADIINLIGPDKAIMDAPENPEKLKPFIRKMLQSKDIELVAEHKADSTYPVVSAASIIAKVHRDREIEELKKKYGNIGPGYSSNQITIQWMKDYMEKHGRLPECVRHSWQTTKNIKGEKKQSRLSGWLGRKD